MKLSDDQKKTLHAKADYVCEYPTALTSLVRRLRRLTGRGDKRTRVYAEMRDLFTEFAINHARQEDKGSVFLTNLFRDVAHNGVSWPVAPFLAWLENYTDEAADFYVDIELIDRAPSDDSTAKEGLAAPPSDTPPHLTLWTIEDWLSDFSSSADWLEYGDLIQTVAAMFEPVGVQWYNRGLSPTGRHFTASHLPAALRRLLVTRGSGAAETIAIEDDILRIACYAILAKDGTDFEVVLMMRLISFPYPVPYLFRWLNFHLLRMGFIDLAARIMTSEAFILERLHVLNFEEALAYGCADLAYIEIALRLYEGDRCPNVPAMLPTVEDYIARMQRLYEASPAIRDQPKDYAWNLVPSRVNYDPEQQRMEIVWRDAEGREEATELPFMIFPPEINLADGELSSAIYLYTVSRWPFDNNEPPWPKSA